MRSEKLLTFCTAAVLFMICLSVANANDTGSNRTWLECPYEAHGSYQFVFDKTGGYITEYSEGKLLPLNVLIREYNPATGEPYKPHRYTSEVTTETLHFQRVIMFPDGGKSSTDYFIDRTDLGLTVSVNGGKVSEHYQCKIVNPLPLKKKAL